MWPFTALDREIVRKSSRRAHKKRDLNCFRRSSLFGRAGIGLGPKRSIEFLTAEFALSNPMRLLVAIINLCGDYLAAPCLQPYFIDGVASCLRGFHLRTAMVAL